MSGLSWSAHQAFPNGVYGKSVAELAMALFLSWQTSRPADGDRVAGIQQLFDVNRRAMDLLAR